MTKFLTLWEMDMTRIPEDPKERTRRDTLLLHMIQEDIKKGIILEWGLFASGDELAGYAICEGTEQDVTRENLKYSPFIKFRTHPVLSINQVEEIVTK